MIFLPEKIKDSEFCATINKMVVGGKTEKNTYFCYSSGIKEENSK